MKRRWLAPEVIQTSAMDCGPAVLKSALEGLGVPVHLGHLREACQTEVDGTSVRTLAELARGVGLEPVQTVLPLDHVRLPEVLPLPAIVVVAQADRAMHFVLLWRSWRGWVQVMDPSEGRRWMRWSALVPLLYRHTMVLPPAQVGPWSLSVGFAGGLGMRLSALCGEAAAEALFERNMDALPALDAATRGAEALREVGALARGAEAAAFVAARLDTLRADPDQTADWAAQPLPDGSWRIQGAVVLMLSPPRSPAVAVQEHAPEALRLALRTAPAQPLRALLRLALGPREAALAVGVGLFAALGGVAQAALLRAVLDAARWLQTPLHRGVAVGVLVGLTLVVVGLGLAWGFVTARLGRRLEAQVRLALHRKLPRLSERYFSSRLLSDLAERAHAIAGLRGVPDALSTAIMSLCGLLGTLVGIFWLDSSLGPLVLLSGLSAVVLPMGLHPYLAARELRRQTYDGALARSYLDAMLGATPSRAHGAEESLRRDHEAVLVRWGRAAEQALNASALAGLVQGAVGLGLAAAMVHTHLAGAEHAGAALLLVYWATGVPAQGEALAAALRVLPALQSVAARAMEPLDAPEEGSRGEVPAPAAWAQGALGVQLEGMQVVAGGRAVLDLPALRLGPGEHVAIVGRSGAGKSALLGVLLGWWRPTRGAVRVNGVALDAAGLPALRRRVAWVDPTVQIWNRTLLDNLRYGQEGAALDTDAVLREADLLEVLAQLPEGLSAPLGANGGLLSGGQGQRVRLGRALGRPEVGLALLDEPFRGLDRGARRALLARARARWAQATLVCVSHDVGDTQSFPRVLVIDGGRVVEDGPPARLAAQGGLYAALLEEERQVQAAWRGKGWRRLRLERGQVQEDIP